MSDCGTLDSISNLSGIQMCGDLQIGTIFENIFNDLDKGAVAHGHRFTDTSEADLSQNYFLLMMQSSFA